MYKTPENKTRRPGRERLYSAPERLQKNETEIVQEKLKKMTLLATRRHSEAKLNQNEDDFFDEIDEYEILKRSIETEKYKCKVCDKKFFHRNALEAHSLVHSNASLYTPVEKCNLCNRKFSSKIKLKIHKNKNHSEGTPLKILAVL